MSAQGRAEFSNRASNAADGKFNINTQTIRSVILPLPPVKEQAKLVEVLHTCDAKIVALEREVTLLDELFRALLEELMIGRLSAVPLIEAE